MNPFEVKRMIMIETARYDDMYLRPYQTHFNQDISNILAESTEFGQNITPTSLSLASTAFLQPSSVPVGQANIANGFGEKRFSFMMEVVDGHQSGLSGGVRYVLTGYTNHLGISQLQGGQSLDPNMQFFFNNLFVLRDTVVDTPHGKEVFTNMSNSSHILHNSGAQDYMTQTPIQYTLRPEDICAHLDYSANPMMGEFRNEEIHDARATLTGVKTSDRRKEARPFYLSESIKAHQSAQYESNTYEAETDRSSVWSGARENLRETPMSKNKFFSVLTGMTNYRNAGFVTYSELCMMMPDMDHRADIITAGRAMQSSEYVRGQGENWNGSTLETMAATLFQQLVPGIMSDCLFTTVGFFATNHTIGGVEDIRMTEVIGFTEGLDYSQHITHFIERLKREILWDVSKGGNITYQVEARINLLYDSHFRISIDGGPFTNYTAPAFCDGLFAPIISTNLHTLETMATDVGSMIDNLTGDLNRMMIGNESPQGHANIGGYHGNPSNFDTSL